MGDLPKNWVNVSLQNVTKNVKGKKPRIQLEDEFEGSVPYLDIKALEYNVVRQFSDVETSKLFEEGDIAMVWDGARSGWVSRTSFGAIGSTLVAFKPILINSDYLYYFLLDKYPYINSNGRGVGIPHVDPTVLWGLNFPLPPLPEQNRIVAKLDALFGQLEIIKASMEKIPVLLKEFRQQVLSMAVSGKLTESWRVGKELEIVDLGKLETEREALKRDKASKDGKKSYNYKKAIFPKFGMTTKGISEFYKVPTSWTWVSIDQVTWNISDGPHFSPKYLDKIGSKRFISMRNVSPSGINFDDCKYISLEDHDEFIKRGKPEKNDILYTKGGSTGIACLIEDDSDFSYWVHVALLKPISKHVNSKFLRNTLLSPLCYNQSQAFTHGVGNQDLGLTRMINISFPLPSVFEQQEIVSRVESLFSKADAIQAQYQSLKQKIDNLPQAILHKAFKGELTEQLDTDGDARELLREIESLKQNIKPTKQPALRMVAEKPAKYAKAHE
ncbi:restriction endonuclease subunit S [Flavobacterium sp.]|uniref:restriction endonuclease subunit S n=1 Tax=Flavobacterium sp. TaxID=239 RepID=UPI0012017A64|nr:restriction endonuclease subunit S [Flavobacterium sp.]RZJ69220.1 MAG: hypothetical protein EOO49_18150 [Flavobacterium sp.]